MKELDITHERYKEIMNQRTTHKHKYDFGYPVFGFHTSYATYYCDCGDAHAVGEGTEMTIEEAHERAKEDWDTVSTNEVLGISE